MRLILLSVLLMLASLLPGVEFETLADRVRAAYDLSEHGIGKPLPPCADMPGALDPTGAYKILERSDAYIQDVRPPQPAKPGADVGIRIVWVQGLHRIWVHQYGGADGIDRWFGPIGDAPFIE
jgi:hypothetical protein